MKSITRLDKGAWIGKELSDGDNTGFKNIPTPNKSTML